MTTFDATIVRTPRSATLPARTVRAALASLDAAQKPGAGVPAYTRWVNRRLARYCAAVAYAAGVSANSVTLISALLSATGLFALVALPIGPVSALTTALLLALGYVLDSADGQVARLSGQSSLAGEWLDHVVDAIRTPAIHLAVIVAWTVHGGEPWLAAIALLYAVVSTGQFMSQILAEQLRRAAGVPSAPPTGGRLRSFALLPTDMGTLCLLFVFWASPQAFAIAYTAMFALNAVHAGLSMRRRHRELLQPVTVEESTLAEQPLRRSVLGVPVDGVTMHGAVDTILDWAHSAEPTRVAVGVNANVCNLAQRDRAFAQQVRNADLAYADGQSVVWASRLLHRPLPERLATTDLVDPLMAACAEQSLAVFLFGGRPGVADAAAQRLRSDHPGLLVETHNGYVPEQHMPDLIRKIRAHGTAVLLVGLGDPLQQQWIAAHRDELGVPAVLSCGGLFDWVSGEHRRAPKWMISAGLEWLWRLMLEPKRLARRYVLGNPAFVSRLTLEIVRQRRSAS